MEEKMKKFELEAAEALAGLAHSTVPQSEPGLPTERLKPVASLAHSAVPQNEPVRPTQQLKPESSRPNDLVTQPYDSYLAPQAQDRGTVVKKRPEKISNTMSKTVNNENSDEFKSGLLGSTSYLSVVGRKSRQCLTESEKEARRLRRVLANREAARQTILRRQAIFEGLTRKAAELALENENLKMEKELAMKDYDSLKIVNDYLKEQMAKMAKSKAENSREDLKLTHAEFSPSGSSRNSFSPCNQTSAVPLHWIPIVQPSVFPMTTTWRPNLFSDQRDSTMTANAGTFLYVLPVPCFFPLHFPMNAVPQLSDQNDSQQTYLSNQCSTTSSKSIVHGEDSLSFFPLTVETETSDSIVGGSADELFAFPPDGGEGTYANRKVFMPTTTILSHVRPLASAGSLDSSEPSASARAGLNTTLQNHDPYVKAIASAPWQITNGVSEENQEPAVITTQNPVEARTAAEARKRRKELMKLKNP